MQNKEVKHSDHRTRNYEFIILGDAKQFSTDLPSKNAHTENRTTTCDVETSVHSDTK